MYHLDSIVLPRLSYGDGKTILQALLLLSTFQTMIILRIGQNSRIILVTKTGLDPMFKLLSKTCNRSKYALIIKTQ